VYSVAVAKERMSNLIALTCASGRQCGALIPLLYKNPQYKLRLVVNSQPSQERLSKQWPEAEVTRANLQIPEECARILKDTMTVLYTGPPFHPYEVTFGMNVIDAAVAEASAPESSFEHFIFSSAIHPELSKMLHHDQKRQIEAYLTESGLPYTILQPSTFVDNFLAQLLAQNGELGKGVFTAASNPDVKMSFSCLKDHAEVTAKIIACPEKHVYATYQLPSTFPITMREYVAQASAAMGGKDFEVTQMPFEKASEMFAKISFGENYRPEERDAPERMLLFYNRRGLLGNPGVLEWLLGRKATSIGEYVKYKLEGTSD
jgi:uncharacterized protein YbjT (DUF2867 family)